MTLTRALIAQRLPESRVPARPPQTVPENLLRASLAGALCSRRAGDLPRIFAFGSLMWERQVLPGALPEPARLGGFARRWHLRDIHNRGVPEAPGLTLGLEPEPGECCDGLLFTLPDDALLWPVWRHEMLPGFYRTEWVTVVPLPQGRPVRALTFIADAAHPLHAGPLPEPAQARVLATAVGPQGPDAEYLLSTQETLRQAGLEDRQVDRLAGMVGRLLAVG
ncbi:gamma-glutamylcyclotransferase [Dankookia rubra]|nr:gamma-glutamylcyclotransferase [Dankookia rubra]